ncbi:hypothetical protein [Brevibacterium yomogidense]|uniref:hypothetical protein n=1 Tax=Brevibacterium yomogidense TaxID=946573 RepID=UPI0018DF2200|nr:hypothetical protein [Brevibacterium yomogidense]
MIDLIVAAATNEPAPSDYPDPDLVTPGTIGFLATFFLATAVVLLARNLLKRQRRMRARAGVVRHHPIPVERTPRTGPQNVGMSTGVDMESSDVEASPEASDPGSDEPRSW